jgi:hypothetical protein
MNQSSTPQNQAMNDGMREALNKSANPNAMKKVSDMMMKTAKMLAMGHLDPTYLMETMDAMQQIMPENTDQADQTAPDQADQTPPADQGPGMGV